jgi:hypothetical protein
VSAPRIPDRDFLPERWRSASAAVAVVGRIDSSRRGLHHGRRSAGHLRFAARQGDRLGKRPRRSGRAAWPTLWSRSIARESRPTSAGWPACLRAPAFLAVRHSIAFLQERGGDFAGPKTLSPTWLALAAAAAHETRGNLAAGVSSGQSSPRRSPWATLDGFTPEPPGPSRLRAQVARP